MSDEERLVAEVPSSLKYLVDDDERTNKEIVISALETELGVQTEDSLAVIDRRIKRLEDEFEREKAELEDRRNRIETVQSKLETAREIRNQKVEDDGSYEDRLDDILDRMENGNLGRVFPTHGVIDDVREEFDRSNEEIHLDLQQRAGAQERPLSVAAFKDSRFADASDERTPIAERWPGGDDDE